jgi:hypothetical protein
MIVHTDPAMSAAAVRELLYRGEFVVCTGLPAVGEFVDHARARLSELFEPHDPEHAHAHFNAEQLAGMLGVWKPRFIHDPRSKELVQLIIEQAGFSATETYFDVPKPRTAFPAGSLNTGIAFAFPWHRDIWYSAPAQQINWWLPIFPVSADNAMSFDPRQFDRPTENDSDRFDYYRNNAARHTTAKQVATETQARPRALRHEADNDLIVLPAPGSVLLFSGAQLHRTIPNQSGRSRYSIDFRTVDSLDLLNGRGAPMVDVHCTGTAIRDFRRVSDGASFDEELLVRLFGAPPAEAELVFSPAR